VAYINTHAEVARRLTAVVSVIKTLIIVLVAVERTNVGSDKSDINGITVSSNSIRSSSNSSINGKNA